MGESGEVTRLLAVLAQLKPRRVVLLRLVALAGLVLGVTLVVAALAMIWAPLGIAAAGVSVIAGVTFDTSKVGSLTWPR